MLSFARGNLIERIVVIHPKEVAGLNPLGPERPENRVVDQDPAQRTHMHTARGGFGVIDNLGAVTLGCNFFTPKHRISRKKDGADGRRERPRAGYFL
jgi:hypothetical protein